MFKNEFKSKVAGELADKLQEYAYDAEEGTCNAFNNEYILDELLEMREILSSDDAEEGRFYQSYSLITDKMVKLHETVTMQTMLSGDSVNLKIMSIDSVRPSKDGKMLIEFLGKKQNI